MTPSTVKAETTASSAGRGTITSMPTGGMITFRVAMGRTSSMAIREMTPWMEAMVTTDSMAKVEMIR
jgi:hypothetical protein